MTTKNLIENNYSTLTKTEKKIADYILGDEEYSMINITLLELAKQLRLGEASIIRFCRKIGFRGFQDLKLTMAIESAKEEDKGELAEVDSGQSMEKMIRVIQNTNDCVNRERLDKAVDIMGTTEHLYFYGAGSSGITAEIAETRFVRMGRRCKALKDSHLQTVQSSIMDSSDVVVAISVSGMTTDLFNTLKIAKDAGSRIIAITNHEHSVIAEISDCVLLSSAPESPMTGGTFESIISQLCVLDLLFSRYSARNRESVNTFRDKVAISINQKFESK